MAVGQPVGGIDVEVAEAGLPEEVAGRSSCAIDLQQVAVLDREPPDHARARDRHDQVAVRQEGEGVEVFVEERLVPVQPGLGAAGGRVDGDDVAVVEASGVDDLRAVHGDEHGVGGRSDEAEPRHESEVESAQSEVLVRSGRKGGRAFGGEAEADCPDIVT